MEKARAGGLGQIGLSRLAVWILGASVFFALVRGATGFWSNPVPILNLDRVAGVILLAACCVVILKLSAAALESGAKSVFGRAWRWVAVLVLLGLATSLSSILRQVERATGFVAFSNKETWPERLHGICLAVGLIGVLLGLVPGPARRPKRRGSIAINVVFAGLSGLLILTVYETAIPYLVLIALEAVQNAMTHPAMVNGYVRFGQTADPVFFDRSLWPSLEQKLIWCGVASAVAMVACGLTAVWIGRDARRSGVELEPAHGWLGLGYRVATASATWIMGIVLFQVALPRLQPNLVEGLWTVVDPTCAAAIVSGFVVLAAGIASRAVAGPNVAEAAPSPRSRVRWLGLMVVKLAIAVGLSLLILAAISRIRGDEVLPWYVPRTMGDLLGTADEWLTVIHSGSIYFELGKNPEALLILGAVVGVIVLLGRCVFGARGEAPIDRIAGDRRRIGRFVGTWIALSGVILTLFPSFVLGGLSLLHFGLKWFGG